MVALLPLLHAVDATLSRTSARRLIERKRQRNRPGGARKFQHGLRTPRWVGPRRCRPCGCAPPCWYQPSWRRAAGGGGEEQLGRIGARLPYSSGGAVSYERCERGCIRVHQWLQMHAYKLLMRFSRPAAAKKLVASTGFAAALSVRGRGGSRTYFSRVCDFEPRRRSVGEQSMLQ